MLQSVPHSHPAAVLTGSGVTVALTTISRREHPVVISGPGAGAEVTASSVLAVWAEDLGFVGVAMVLGLFYYVVHRGIVAARSAQEFVVVTANSDATVSVTDSTITGSGDVTIGSDSR